MKKRLVTCAAALSAAAILTLAGCSHTPDLNVSSEIDTVLNLAKPEVKVTAYPGMNYVSWAPVANAYKYVLYIYEDGNHVETKSVNYNADLIYVDKEIQNNKSYRYIVEAVSKDHNTREVHTENSLSNPVTVNAIVPPYETSPLELYKFESGSKNAEYVVSAANINAYKDNDSTIGITFPGKAYLNYNVYYSINDEFEACETKTSVKNSLSNKASNDSTLHTSLGSITTSGTYHFIVEAKAENTKYGKTDRVVADKTVVVEQLKGGNAAITSAAYKSDDTVRVVFSGFKFTADESTPAGTIAPAEYYKVYRSVNLANSTTFVPTIFSPVTGTVKATDSSETSFYVEDSIEDTSVAYTYTLVVTDGTRYAEMKNNMRAYVAPKAAISTFTTPTISSSIYCLDNDDYKNDIEWTITLPVEDTTINSIYYLEKDDDAKVIAKDFVKDVAHKVEVTSAGDKTRKVYKAFTKDHTPGSDVYILVSISKEGYYDAEFVSGKQEIKEHDSKEPEFTSMLYDNNVNGSTKPDYKPVYNDVVLNISDSLYDDQLDLFTYAIYEAKPASVDTTTDTIIWDFETSDWILGEANTQLQQKGLKKDEYESGKALNTYTAVIELIDLEPGVHAWKLVKKNKITGKVYPTQIEYKVVIGKAADSIKYKPVISATKVNPGEANSAVKITFTKDNTPNEFVKGTSGALDGLNVSVVSEEEEAGVTYTVYRRILVGSDELAKVVWTEVGKVETTDHKTANTTCWRLDNNGDPEEFVYTYTDYIDYSFTDKDLPTGDGYQYVVLCEKDGCAPVYSEMNEGSPTITPIN